jgi:hypothetical protein
MFVVCRLASWPSICTIYPLLILMLIKKSQLFLLASLSILIAISGCRNDDLVAVALIRGDGDQRGKRVITADISKTDEGDDEAFDSDNEDDLTGHEEDTADSGTELENEDEGRTTVAENEDDDEGSTTVATNDDDTGSAAGDDDEGPTFLALEYDYVFRQQGAIPIILTAPHAGSGQPSFLDQRQACSDSSTPSGCRGGGCTKGGDANTFALTMALADAIYECSGSHPYYVIGNIHRKYIDYNRDAYDPRGQLCSFRDPDAMPYWEAFHNQIEDYVAEIQDDCGDCGLLIDVHGFTRSGRYNTLVLGMGNTQGLFLPNLNDHDDDLGFVYEDGGLVPNILDEGHGHIDEVIPNAIDGSYEGLYTGGYIPRRYSRTYSSWGGPQSNPTLPMIDSMQMEFGRRLRTDPNRNNDDVVRDSAIAVAQSICDAWQNHLDWWPVMTPPSTHFMKAFFK